MVIGGVAAISAFTVVIHLMLPIAPVINAVMIPPIMALGAAAGVNPALYAPPVIFTASCTFLLPLDAVPLVTYSRGYYRMFDMLPAGLVISAVWVVLMTALSSGCHGVRSGPRRAPRQPPIGFMRSCLKTFAR